MPHNYVPEMTNSGLSPTQKVLVKDEYENTPGTEFLGVNKIIEKATKRKWSYQKGCGIG